MKTRTMKTLIGFLVLFFLGFDCFAGIPRYVRKFTEINKQEPSYSQVLSVYLKEQGLSKNTINRLRKKIKAAPYFPTLSVGYDHSFREREGLSVTDNISISGGAVTMGPDDNDYNYYDYLGQTIHVRAVWKLDEIIFNRNHFLIENVKREHIKLETMLADALYKIYEERTLCLIKYLQYKRASSRQASLFYGKYLSLTGKLDAMTGGVFRKKWWREGG